MIDVEEYFTVAQGLLPLRRVAWILYDITITCVARWVAG